MLSAFQVDSSKDRGYVASQSMTGARTAILLKDLPFTVDVIPSEFLKDFSLFELNDNVAYVGGFAGLDQGGTFVLRGFTSTNQLRDGFFRLGRYGSSSIDRIDIVKGPNASIYGRTSPGGMLNMISKKPSKILNQTLELTYGDYNTKRAELDATGPLGTSGKTSYVLTLQSINRDFDGQYESQRNSEAYLAVQHDFADKSHLLLSVEYFLQKRVAPVVPVVPMLDQKGTAATTDDIYDLGYARAITKVSPYGPNSELSRGNNSYTATYDKEINRVFSIRTGLNYYQARRWEFNQTGTWGTSINVNTPSGLITTTHGAAAPQRGVIFEDGGSAQNDVLAHYPLFNGAVDNKTLWTIDFSDYYRNDPNSNVGPSADLTAYAAARTVPLTFDGKDLHLANDPSTLVYYRDAFDWNNKVPQRYTKRRITVLGSLLRQEMDFLDHSLLVFAGVRVDRAWFHGADINGTGSTAATPWVVAAQGLPPGTSPVGVKVTAKLTETETKPNVGANYKLTKNLRLYANYSQSYFIDQQTTPQQLQDPTFRPETAAGYDYGIKSSFLDDKLNLTVGGYYITRENVSVTDTVETFPGSGIYTTASRPDGNQLVRGVEVEGNFRFTRDWTLGGSFAHTNSIYTDFGAASPMSAGRSVALVPSENGGAYLKWAPGHGTLKGFSVNVGVTYISSSHPEAPNAGDTYTQNKTTGVETLVSSNYQWALTLPSYTLWNLGVRYILPWRVGKTEQTIGFNITNAFDKEYVRFNNKFIGDRRTFVVNYTIAHF